MAGYSVDKGIPFLTNESGQIVGYITDDGVERSMDGQPIDKDVLSPLGALSNVVTVDPVTGVAGLNPDAAISPFTLSAKSGTIVGAAHGWWSGSYVVRSNDEYGDVSYIGWGSPDGDFGVTRYDHATNRYERKSLGGNDVDDHNVPGLALIDKGRVAIAYARHAEDTHIKFRTISSRAGFDVSEESIIESAGLCTYAQLIYKQGKLFLFYRRDVDGFPKTWCMRYTSNAGVTWSDEVSILSNEYALFVDTGDSNTLKFFVYAHPTSGSDHDVFSGSIRTDLGTMRAKSVDVANVFTGVGCPVDMTSLQKVVDIPDGTTGTRLFAAQSDTATSFAMLGAEFSQSVELTNTLYRYEYPGSTTAAFVKTPICDFGKAFYSASRYFGGACFAPGNRNKAYVCRNDGAETPAWEVSVYEFSGGVWAKTSVAYGPVTDVALLARPIPFGDDQIMVTEISSYPTFSSYSGAKLRIVDVT